jgi:hypothetical protein
MHLDYMNGNEMDDDEKAKRGDECQCGYIQ